MIRVFSFGNSFFNAKVATRLSFISSIEHLRLLI